MSVTELDEVQALLEHVLPDPAGFAQRLLLQAMTRWGQSAGPGASASHPGANAFYTAATAEDVTLGETVTTPGQWPSDEEPVNTNILLAGALGACECWGLRANCYLCQGRGSAGWTQPDPELFEEFVRPAIARMSPISVNAHEQHGSTNADQDHHNHQTGQGENT